MQFDPAISARLSFKRAQESGELGQDSEKARAAEETFSESAGSDAKAAYRMLLEIGERHPDAIAFQEFLIYSTWQQVTEETIPAHFQRGAELCDRYLGRLTSGHDETQAAQISDLRQSFRAGLGLGDEEEDYDEDTLKGGD
ncbi:MAG TPA: hypothetical protein VGJ57_03325 [Nitrospirales bacterium]